MKSPSGSLLQSPDLCCMVGFCTIGRPSSFVDVFHCRLPEVFGALVSQTQVGFDVQVVTPMEQCTASMIR